MLVKAVRDHFDGVFRKAGEEFEYNGKPHEHLVPVKRQPKTETEEEPTPQK